MFYGGEEASPLQARGLHHASKGCHQHLLQEQQCFLRYVQLLSCFGSSTGGYSFSTGTDSLPTGRRGSSTGKCQISTGSSVFYRKLPVEGYDGRNVFQMKI